MSQKHDIGFKKRQWARLYGPERMSPEDRAKKKYRSSKWMDTDAIAVDIAAGVLPPDPEPERKARR
jgi:hypothetical protein